MLIGVQIDVDRAPRLLPRLCGCQVHLDRILRELSGFRGGADRRFLIKPVVILSIFSLKLQFSGIFSDNLQILGLKTDFHSKNWMNSGFQNPVPDPRWLGENDQESENI